MSSDLAQLGVAALRDATIEQLEANRPLLDTESYARAHHALSEMQRVHAAVAALKADDYSRLGQLLNESHRSLRDDYQVSCPELDVAVNAAIAAGALGARMVGGGFGGSAIALVKAEEVPAIETAVAAAFAKAGFGSPRFFVAESADGAQAELLEPEA